MYYTHSISRSVPAFYVLVVGAAGLITIDREFGYSERAARFAITASELSRMLNDFRVKWALAQSRGGKRDELLELVRNFQSQVETVV
jgi:hypothetical protein